MLCDVDGTLLGPAEQAREAVVDAVRRTQDAGLRVGLATGRMRGGTDVLRRQLQAAGPHVFHNGAEVWSDGATIAVTSLTAAQVDALLAFAATREDLYLEVYLEDGFVVSSRDERARRHWELLGSEPLGVLARAAELDGAVVPKATFALFTPDGADEAEAAIAAAGLRGGGAGSPLTPEMHYINATHPDVDKGRAVARAAEHLGLALAATVAIGDASNDLPLLATAGTAIAMGQAPAAVKAAAHLVAPPVDDDGAAVALEAVVGWSRPGT